MDEGSDVAGTLTSSLQDSYIVHRIEIGIFEYRSNSTFDVCFDLTACSVLVDACILRSTASQTSCGDPIFVEVYILLQRPKVFQ